MSEGGGGNSGGTGDGGEKVTGKAGTHAAKPKVLHELLPKKVCAPLQMLFKTLLSDFVAPLQLSMAN